MSGTEIERDLQAIEAVLSDIEQPPATTLEILGEATQEQAWEALLAYFIDADNPHGFGTDVLSAFLEALSSHEDTSLPSRFHDLGQVKVQTQVPTGNGPFDILLWCDDAWFVCIELKVDAAESGSQTERYAQATKLGDLVVNQHSGVGEYAYLAPSSARSSTSETFVDVSWEHVVPYLKDVLTGGQGQYPLKSFAQLADYLDTIQQELNMDESTTVSEETKLYTEYADTIDRLIQSFEDDKDRIYKQLTSAFFDKLGDDQEDQEGQEGWHVNQTGRYVNYAKEHWSGVASSVNIEYEVYVKLNQDHPEITLRLDIEYSGKHQIRDELRERLTEDEISALNADDWEFVDGSYAYISKSVMLDLETPDHSIRNAIRELHEFRDIVEPHIEEIVSDHQETP